MIFESERHERTYEELLRRVVANGYRLDEEVKPVMYLVALIGADVAGQMFDFAERKIKPGVINAPWQTGSSLRATRLAFNLWNGFPTEDQRECTPYAIFGNLWDPYFFQAIKLRFPCINEE